MIFRLFAPCPEMADIVATYWYVRIERNIHVDQQYTTPLYEGLVFNFSNLKGYVQKDKGTELLTNMAYLTGQVTSKTAILACPENEGYIIGVKLKPLGLARLTGINMAHIVNTNIDAEAIWGQALNNLCEAMQEAAKVEQRIQALEKFLMKQRQKIKLHSRSENVTQAINLMSAYHGNISCKALQDMTNTSKKTLERYFVNYHGMPPKMYIRIIRFNEARMRLEQGLQTSFTGLAYELGYSDQAHFIRDFKHFSGQTPSGYVQTIEALHKQRTIPINC